ncbi:hypothetical protein AJ79_09502 [Helicocarpus griseus UAMH5409]|uniref:Uncharacterized protein n=1 Tax=Helicocarpus griseus UAMH5409 TaxID=1447875 RepID=A0A2B7WJB9_9EURO|nr:hypothetical protein AJ79_09502 [Helicocarpus griseus UAMH5409]
MRPPQVNVSRQSGHHQQSGVSHSASLESRSQRASSFPEMISLDNPSTVPTGQSQSPSMRLPPIDGNRAHASGRLLPSLYGNTRPVNQQQNYVQRHGYNNRIDNRNSNPRLLPNTNQPPAGHGYNLQSTSVREIEFHCINAAHRFWETHRPQPMLKLVGPNAARPSRPYGSGTLWRPMNVLTDPAFHETRMGWLREYLSLIADLDWERVRQRQQLQMAPGQQQTQPQLIQVPPPSIPNTNDATSTGRRAYPHQFANIQLLDDLHSWCEIVMSAVYRVHVGDVNSGPVLLTRAELAEVVRLARWLVTALNGTTENEAIGQVWARCVQAGI